MTTKADPYIEAAYYDPRYGSATQPKNIARRCTGKIIELGHKLGMISAELSLALRRKDIGDAVNLCQYHHENMLLRIYSLRERAWDVLAALVDIPRKNTGNKGFRSSVLSKTKTAYPEPDALFSDLQHLMEWDVETRNVATHRTSLFLTFVFRNPSGDIHSTHEVDSVLYLSDPQSEDGLRMQQMVRRALREFVAEDRKHIAKIITAASNFAKHSFDSISSKQWKNV